MDRQTYFTKDLNKDMVLMEIGPSYCPLVERSQGWQVMIVDHASREELHEKYRDWGVDTSKIEEVDFVWNSGELHDAVPRCFWGSYDRVFACHVIEHMPNLLQFLRSLSRLLKPDGLLGLAVPDKRFSFDYFRPVTLTSDVVFAAESSTSIQSIKSGFEVYFYSSIAGSKIAWWNEPPGKLSLAHDWSAAVDSFDKFKRVRSGKFQDLHASVFTPSSFSLIMLELGMLGLTELSVRDLVLTNTCEFYVHLEKNSSAIRLMEASQIQQRRTELMLGILKEVNEQANYLRQIVDE